MRTLWNPDEMITHLPEVRRWTLEVRDTNMITPHMRRIRLASQELSGLASLPGQDIMLWVPADGGRMVYRRYTIRSLDRAAGWLDLDIFAHGAHGPGARWAATAKPGDQVEAVGPRGKITLADAAWHLFAGDESFLPATCAMLEALPAGTPAWAFLEVAGPEEEQPLSVSADVRLTWVHRGDTPPGEPAFLSAAVSATTLPASSGQVYIGAELQVVAALRRTFEDRGVDSTHISAKAYWGRGRANESHGEPDRDVESRKEEDPQSK